MSSNLKRKLAIGAAGLAAVAFGGGAYAATQSKSDPRQAFINDLAQRLHITPKQLTAAISGAALDQLQAAVKAGKLTQAQADAIKRAMSARGGVPPFGLGVPVPMFPGGPLFHRRFGPGKRFGPFMRPRFFGAGPAPLAGPLGGAASYLGLTDQQLFSQLMSGKSLAQVAQARHRSVSGLQSAMVNAVKARLDKAVAAKLLTKAQEQQILSHIPAIIQRKVQRPGYGPRFRFFHGAAGALPRPPAPPPGGPAGGIAVAPAGVPY